MKITIEITNEKLFTGVMDAIRNEYSRATGQDFKMEEQTKESKSAAYDWDKPWHPCALKQDNAIEKWERWIKEMEDDNPQPGDEEWPAFHAWYMGRRAMDEEQSRDKQPGEESEPETPRTMTMVLVGNFAGTCKLYGPFVTKYYAQQWAKDVQGEQCFIMQALHPNPPEGGTPCETTKE